MTSMFTRLLELQELDTSIEQLQFKRANLPQRRELRSLAAAAAAIDAAEQPVKARRAELAAQERRLEDEASTVEHKAASEDKRLYSGTVTSPRELQAIQSEIDALRRRQRELEDHALELMVEIEPLDEQLRHAAAEHARIDEQREQTAQTLTIAEAAVDVELQADLDKRARFVADLPPSLVSSYESLRKRLGTVAVARLEAGSCRGCHLKLSSVDLDRVMHEPPDAIVNCEQCGCILVR